MFLIKNDRGRYWSEMRLCWGDLHDASLYRRKNPRDIAKLTNPCWVEDRAIDELQFARLIVEADTAGLFEGNAFDRMCQSINLGAAELAHIINHAQDLFYHAKERLPK